MHIYYKYLVEQICKLKVEDIGAEANRRTQTDGERPASAESAMPMWKRHGWRGKQCTSCFSNESKIKRMSEVASLQILLIVKRLSAPTTEVKCTLGTNPLGERHGAAARGSALYAQPQKWERVACHVVESATPAANCDPNRGR